jgi:hypothetical protein
MRPVLIGLALLVAPGLVFAACGQDPSTAATGSSASGTGGAPNCDGVYYIYSDKDGGHPCDICLHEKCCAELANCKDPACIECVISVQPACSLRSSIAKNCVIDRCVSECSGGPPPGAGGAGGATSSSSGG